MKNLKAIQKHWREEFEKTMPTNTGQVKQIWNSAYGKGGKINEEVLFKDIEKNERRICFECGEWVGDNINQGYYKYESGQEICYKCEPILRNKRLAYRDRVIKHFLDTAIAGAVKEVLEDYNYNFNNSLYEARRIMGYMSTDIPALYKSEIKSALKSIMKYSQEALQDIEEKGKI